MVMGVKDSHTPPVTGPINVVALDDIVRVDSVFKICYYYGTIQKIMGWVGLLVGSCGGGFTDRRFTSIKQTVASKDFMVTWQK